MTDTIQEIAKIQFEIFTKKPLTERMEIWGGMINFVRQNQINRIKNKFDKPLTEAEIKYEIINENYGKEQGPERMAELKKAILG